MKIALSKLIGMYVISEQAEQAVSIVTGVHIDPETGKIIALQCAFKKVLCTIDIRAFGRGVFINDENALCTEDEVLRLKNLNEKGDQLMGKIVYDEDNQLVGIVYDIVLDMSAMSLHQIVVKKKFLFFTQSEFLIQKKHIIAITPTKVIIKSLPQSEKVHSPVMEVA